MAARMKVHKHFYVSTRLQHAVSLAPSPPTSIPHISLLQNQLEQFASFVNESRNLLIISGAGISTDSGTKIYDFILIIDFI